MHKLLSVLLFTFFLSSIALADNGLINAKSAHDVTIINPVDIGIISFEQK